MPHDLTSSILEAITAPFTPHMIAFNIPNSVHLAVATIGYWIQSQQLKIPDRYGFFSLGPPRLQVH